MTARPNHPNISLVKPNRPRFVEVDELAAMVSPGDTFGVGGHHFARLPIALLRAIGRSGVKDLRYVSWAGGLPLELLLEAGAIAEIDICFSSLDIFGLPPRFRAAAETNALPVRDWTALAMIQALRAAQQNLPSMPFQLPDGSDMLARMPRREDRARSRQRRRDRRHPRPADRYVRPPRPTRRRKRQCADHRAARAGLRDGRRRAPGAGHGRGDRPGRRAAQRRPPKHPDPEPGVCYRARARRSLSGVLPAFLRDRLSGSVPRLRLAGQRLWRTACPLRPRGFPGSFAKPRKFAPTLFQLSVPRRCGEAEQTLPSTKSLPHGSRQSSATTVLPAPARSRRWRMSPTGWQRPRTRRT